MFNPKYGNWKDPSSAQFSGLSISVVIYVLLVITAIVVNITMLAVLLRLRKRLFQPPGTFYTVFVGLFTFTFLNAIVQAVFVAPQYIQNTSEVTNAYLRVYFVLDMLSNYGILGFSTLVAANRFSTFNLGSKCPVFRRYVRLYLLIAVVFLIVALLAAIPSFLGCMMLQAATAAVYVDYCPDEKLAEGVKIGLGAIYYVVCAFSAYFYVRTYWLIKNQRGHLIQQESHRKAPEIIILKQALVIFGLYIISLVLTTIVPLFSSSHSFLLSYFLNSISLLLSIAYPGLLLVSCGEMRSGLPSVLSAIYFVLVATALILNVTMLVVLFRLRKRLFEPPTSFYTVVVGLIAFTTLSAIVQAVFIAPQYAMHESLASPPLSLEIACQHSVWASSALCSVTKAVCTRYSSSYAAFLYAKTYWLIKHQRGHLIEHEGHRTAPETIILKQALVIFAIYIISLILSTILPLFSSSSSFLLSFSLNTVSLLLSSVYPGLFLVSCGEMRREVASWFPFNRLVNCWKRSSKRVVSAQSISSGVKDSQGTTTAT